MAHFSQHTGEDRAFLVLCRTADFSEAEGTESAVMALGLADLGPDLCDSDFHSLGCSAAASD